MARKRKQPPPSKLSLAPNFNYNDLALQKTRIEKVIKVVNHYQKKFRQQHGLINVIIEDLVGQGGSGNVFKCTSPQETESFAIKFPVDVDETNQKRVNDDLMMTLTHPNIVSPTGDNLPYGCIKMPLWTTSLHEWMRTPFELDGEQLLTLVNGLCSAVDELNRNNLVHRDIKPANVLVRTDDTTNRILEVGLTDFGSMDVICESSAPSACGTTVGYRPPEVVCKFGTGTGMQCDIWSIGTIILTLLVPNIFQKVSDDEIKHLLRTVTGCSKENVSKISASDFDGKRLLEALQHPERKHIITSFQQLDAFNMLEGDLMDTLKQCFRLIPQQRTPWNSIKPFMWKLQKILTSDAYVFNLLHTPPPQLPTHTCTWDHIVRESGRLTPTQLWFVAVMWVATPNTSTMLDCWFKGKLPTTRARRFQESAQLLWSGDRRWKDGLVHAQSQELLYSDHMKLPKTLCGDTGVWKVQGIVESIQPTKIPQSKQHISKACFNTEGGDVEIHTIGNCWYKLKPCNETAFLTLRSEYVPKWASTPKKTIYMNHF